MAVAPGNRQRSLERASTGISELDSALTGGFPRGSLILVSGNPGTGKTILTSTFLCSGAKKGEKGVYVSFSEGKRSYYENLMTLGMDFQQLEDRGVFQFREMLSSTKEAMAKNVTDVIQVIQKMGAKRLVIDSYSVMSQSLEDPYKARQVLHTVLSKVVRALQCTTIVIGELATIESSSREDSSEFVADGVIVLKLAIPRELEIKKMRGTRLVSRKMIYTIDGGFDVLKTRRPEVSRRKYWQPIPDKGGLLSSGSKDWDATFGGGFPRGTYVLLETATNVDVSDIRLVSRSTALNFISQNRGAQIVPRAGLDADDVHSSIGPFVKNELFEKYVRVTESERIRSLRGQTGRPPRYVVQLKDTESPEKSTIKALFDSSDELKRSTGGQPIFRSVAYDALDSYFQDDPDEFFAEVGIAQTRTKSGGDLTYGIARPSLRILDRVRDLVEWHFVLSRKHGVFMIQGMKPETPLYAVDCDTTMGYPVMKLRLLT